MALVIGTGGIDLVGGSRNGDGSGDHPAVSALCAGLAGALTAAYSSSGMLAVVVIIQTDLSRTQRLQKASGVDPQ